jgi:aldehyde dehydrogenase (NAD+)
MLLYCKLADSTGCFPVLEFTFETLDIMEDIKEIIERQTRFFGRSKTRDIEFRKRQLRKLKALLKANERKLYEAIYRDFRKSEFETYETELSILYGEINAAVKNLDRWSKPKRVRTNLANMPGSSFIIPEPYGKVLVIGAWNYPYLLSLSPVVAAVAAGNTVVLKPSEISAESSAVIASVINGNFPDDFLTVVEGGVAETQSLLAHRWDYIFFTGSPHVGKIVYQAAAKHLTPVTLELGGKSPAIVFDDAELKIAAKRIVWGKFLNAGQTCIAPDFLLVHKKISGEFLSLITNEIKILYGEKPSESEAFTAIINDRNFDRLNFLLQSSTVYYGGVTDAAKRYISPTVLYPVNFEEEVMKQEIFGPLLPVIEFDDFDHVLPKLKAMEKPLALYVFTSGVQNEEKVLRELSFGGGAVNDTIFHFANPYLPFGGVGNSGIGAYHHYEGFKTFSHMKGIVKKATWFDPFMKYPPYTALKKKLIRFFVE